MDNSIRDAISHTKEVFSLLGHTYDYKIIHVVHSHIVHENSFIILNLKLTTECLA